MSESFPDQPGEANHVNDSAREASPGENLDISDELAAKLPRPPAPKPDQVEAVSPAVRRDINRAFFILLGSGLLIGALTAVGVVWLMDRLNLIGVPEQTDQTP